MPSRFLGFLMKGKEYDMPSLDFIVIEELDREPVGTKALTHDIHEITTRMQANRNMILCAVVEKMGDL
jgi:hypothetical protein